MYRDVSMRVSFGEDLGPSSALQETSRGTLASPLVTKTHETSGTEKH